MKLSPRALIVAAAFAASTGALADPVNKYTITGRASAAAEAQGVPLDQTPKPPAPDGEAAAGEPGADPAAASQAGPPKPRIERYGLFGLSWRSQ
ncbi:hypothetical protein [Chenggangzhangella methanolivorans]|uniref:DUF4148 domain-containing protein n=1 Tax=Chenggangzhangella methanolivorans TaxID=1437009 RepID=A0A9E6RBS2_9HYPH|nr:hypothetical protein [Chenggangzhangella methanolivorans]QZO00298.1 hypothetical protein K6K41_00380 [Chenggangzhangella methanolivorans]